MLSYSCNNGDKEYTEFIERIEQKANKYGLPLEVCFELIPFCNFDCNMCYVHLKDDVKGVREKILTAEQWIRLGEETAKLGTMFLTLTGGEALMRSDFREIYLALKQMGFLITVRSNGYLMNEQTIAFFTKYRPYNISITMYGSTNETYNKVCGINNGYDVVSKNVLALMAANLPVSVSSTVTRDNHTEMETLINWGREHGIHILAFRGLVNSVRGKNDHIDALRVRYTDEECHIDDGMRFKIFHSERDVSRIKAFSICRGFGHRYTILWDGRMVGCNTFTSIYEEPLNSSIGDCFSRLIQRLDALKRPAECETCRYFDFCDACPSVFLSDTGDCEKTCEEICRKARCHYKRALLIKEEDSNEDKK